MQHSNYYFFSFDERFDMKKSSITHFCLHLCLAVSSFFSINAMIYQPVYAQYPVLQMTTQNSDPWLDQRMGYLRKTFPQIPGLFAVCGSGGSTRAETCFAAALAALTKIKLRFPQHPDTVDALSLATLIATVSGSTWVPLSMLARKLPFNQAGLDQLQIILKKCLIGRANPISPNSILRTVLKMSADPQKASLFDLWPTIIGQILFPEAENSTLPTASFSDLLDGYTPQTTPYPVFCGVIDDIGSECCCHSHTYHPLHVTPMITSCFDLKKEFLTKMIALQLKTGYEKTYSIPFFAGLF